MVWFIFFFLVVGTVAVVLANKNQQKLMGAAAEYEKLQRTNPDDPLAIIGPTEFQVAFDKARKNQGNSMLKGMLIWFLLGWPLAFLLMLPIGFIFESSDLAIANLAMTPWASALYGMYRARKKQIDIFDQMRLDVTASA